MSALLGADEETVVDLCRQASLGEMDLVMPANWNGAGQVVVAGHASAVSRLELLAAKKRVRSTRLKVSAPFHSSLMAPAAERLRSVVAKLEVRAPLAPLVSNVEALETKDPARIAELLVAQVASPVRWEECAKTVMAKAGEAIEIGPGRALGGLLRRMDRSFPCRPTGDLGSIREVLAEVRA
jgi:[acyl-carrier-protein] S-malonyltransferase